VQSHSPASDSCLVRVMPESAGQQHVGFGVRMKTGLSGCLLVALAASGCGSTSTVKLPSRAVQRNVAGRFATAVLHGDVTGARALLVPAEDEALASLVQRAAAPWRTQHASIRLPARRAGNRWTFSYTGRRTQTDGSFETQSGDLVVLVSSSRTGASVQFFIFRHVRRHFSTHHDSQLQPSKR
jgi:hypothetical protein